MSLCKLIGRSLLNPVLSSNRVIVDKCLSMRSRPSIQLSSGDVLVDEKVRITVDGLHSNQKVSLLMTLNENNKLYASCAHYNANEQGQVDTFQSESFGGSFKGVQDMGMFTSTTEVGGSSRLMKADVTTPYDVTLSIHDGHKDFESLAVDFVADRLCPLSSTSLTRRYMAAGVRRISVREGRLRGTLLLPPGNGPFPGLLDVFGLAGGLFEYRAALLASHGFASFALAYIWYDDLTKDPYELRLDYFLEAIDWLRQRPDIIPGGVGMVGHCFGGSLCMTAAACSPHVKVLASTNANPFVMIKGDYECEGIPLKAIMVDSTKCPSTDGGIIQKYGFEEYTIKDHIIPLWLKDTRVLILVGEDDMCVDVNWQRDFEAAIPPAHRHKFKFLYYPGAGHLLEQPYAPFCKSSYNKIMGVTHLWGGDPEHHLLAQDQSWRKLLEFLNKHMRAQAKL